MNELNSGKVTYVYLPVPDLKAARTFYRDTIGLEEAWREGETTCAFKLPGTELQLMLDETRADAPQRAGLVFTVPDTDAFCETRQQQLEFLHAPFDIPGGGRWVGLKDAGGHSIYVADIQ